MYKILYVSNLCSDSFFDYILESSSVKPSQAGQKYHKLLSEGLAMHKDTCKVETLSRIPVIAETHKKRFWNIKSEEYNNIRFNYIPMINIPILHSISVMIFSFFKTLYCTSRGTEKKIILCDVLSFSISFGTLMGAKLKRIKCIGIITDLPSQVNPGIKRSKFIHNFLYTIINFFTLKYDGYILIAEKMNEVINPQKKPYCVIEGIVNNTLNDDIQDREKDFPRNIIYAGGIYEKYGVKMLIDAFMSLPQKDIQLSIYGAGPMESDMENFCTLDKRIKYYGIVSNDKVVAAQKKATLLVNTRSSKEEFTKYSFPSKNIEYMFSGTPVATTKLQGIPNEYFSYLYIFDDETEEGLARTLYYILSLPDKDLQKMGNKAKTFVIENKNNFRQAQKVLHFLLEYDKNA